MRRYRVLDVFTDEALTGNPLAVVLDADGLDDAAMQAIAREFNLSETVFVRPPASDRHRARLRIFTPAYELGFAGHPIVGTASLLELMTPGPTADSAFGLEIAAGDVPCVVERIGERTAYARFRAPKLPEVRDGALAGDAAAAALGLEPREVGFGRHAPRLVSSGGSVFHCVPAASLEALARAAPTGAFAQTMGKNLCYVYAAAEDADAAHWRTRMFAPQAGVPEDPATGSAAVAFAGALMAAEPLGEGAHDIVIRQGVEMGRASRIGLQMRIEEGRLAHLEIGGRAVIVAEGALLV